jgi:hypothetical protein
MKSLNSMVRLQKRPSYAGISVKGVKISKIKALSTRRINSKNLPPIAKKLNLAAETTTNTSEKVDSYCSPFIQNKVKHQLITPQKLLSVDEKSSQISSSINQTSDSSFLSAKVTNFEIDVINTEQDTCTENKVQSCYKKSKNHNISSKVPLIPLTKRKLARDISYFTPN